jgi:hypothetical protein
MLLASSTIALTGWGARETVSFRLLWKASALRKKSGRLEAGDHKARLPFTGRIVSHRPPHGRAGDFREFPHLRLHDRPHAIHQRQPHADGDADLRRGQHNGRGSGAQQGEFGPALGRDGAHGVEMEDALGDEQQQPRQRRHRNVGQKIETEEIQQRQQQPRQQSRHARRRPGLAHDRRAGRTAVGGKAAQQPAEDIARAHPDQIAVEIPAFARAQQRARHGRGLDDDDQGNEKRKRQQFFDIAQSDIGQRKGGARKRPQNRDAMGRKAEQPHRQGAGNQRDQRRRDAAVPFFAEEGGHEDARADRQGDRIDPRDIGDQPFHQPHQFGAAGRHT